MEIVIPYLLWLLSGWITFLTFSKDDCNSYLFEKLFQFFPVYGKRYDFYITIIFAILYLSCGVFIVFDFMYFKHRKNKQDNGGSL